LLDEYLYKRQHTLDPYIRYQLVDKNTITAGSFLDAFEKNYLLNPVSPPKIDPPEYIMFKDIFYTLSDAVITLQENRVSEKDFNIRCEILCRILNIPFSQLLKYFNDSETSFQLFPFIYNLIFKSAQMKNTKKLILRHSLGYSTEYPKLDDYFILNSAQISKPGLRLAKRELYRNISSLVSKLKILLPYFGYSGMIDTSSGLIKITPAIVNYIKKSGDTEYITPLFIARVLSIIYDYDMVSLPLNGEVNYYLIKKELSKKYNLLHRFKILEVELKASEKDSRSHEYRDFILWVLNQQYLISSLSHFPKCHSPKCHSEWNEVK
jgi:hypothetical protein